MLTPKAYADSDITVTYNLPAVPGLTDNQFHHNILFTGMVVAAGNGNSVHNNLPDINGYSLQVDVIPAGYIVGNNPHPIPINKSSGAPVNITINIQVDNNNPPPGVSGNINVTYNLPAVPGLTDNQFQHNITFNNAIVAAGNGASMHNNLATGNYQLTVDVLPAGYLVANNPHPIPVTVTNGQTTNVVVNIIIDQNNPPAGLSGNVQVVFNLPQGVTDNQFHHRLETLPNITVVAAGNGNTTFNNIPAGNYQLNVDVLPNNCLVVNNPHPIPVSVTAGQTATVTVNIGSDPNGTCGGAPGPQNGNVQVTYNLPQGVSDNQFHHNLETLPPTVTVVGAGNGNGTINNIPAGNYQLNVDVLPNNCIVANNPHPIPVTVTAGQTTQVTVNITSDPNGTCGGAPGGQNGNVQVTYNLPQGVTDNQFHHNLETLPPTVTVVGAGNGNGTINNIPAGNYQLNVDLLPLNCIVVNNPHPIPVTVTAGQTTQVTVNITSDPNGTCGGPAPGAAGFIVTPTNGLVTTEAGGQATFTVALNTLPTADVTISITSSNPAEGTTDVNSLTFTNLNGTTAQTVTITGVDDAVADGAVAYTIITGVAVSTDGNYNGLNPADVSVVNNDNDGGNNGGTGGGGRRRDRSPNIVFLYNQETTTAITLEAGKQASVTVIATDPRNFGVILSMMVDPSGNKESKASFTVLNQEASSVTGTLTWTPTSESIGTNTFVFHATNNYEEVEEALPITVVGNGSVGGGGSGGGSTGGTNNGGAEDLETRFQQCIYNDNKTESVIYLCLLGIIDPPSESSDYDGNSKGRNFFGDQPIDRAAFTKIMVNITYEESAIERIAKLILDNNFFPFPDVEPIAWFAKFISVAALDKHVDGYPHNGLFVPWNNIEISEAAKILFNTASHDNAKIGKDLEKAMKDVGKEPWFMRYALLAYAYGGYTPKVDKDMGLIYSQKLTRQQAADMIYTTILNAGIEPKGKLSQLKQQLLSTMLDDNGRL
ncbi:MAG: collagen binding domain-containing protein [Candidatus Altimarinota bacterium]